MAGTRIGILLEFNKDGYVTVTGYKDGVRVGVLCENLKGPLCPSFWAAHETGTSVEFVESRPPPWGF